MEHSLRIFGGTVNVVFIRVGEVVLGQALGNRDGVGSVVQDSK